MKSDTAKRPRTKSAEIRREELMDAAQALFLEKGFAATNVSEIVEGADVAKGTFYLYFKTKDEVLTALQTRFIDGFCKQIDAAMAKDYESWAARIQAWVSTCVNAYLDAVAVHDLVFHQHQPANRAMKAGNPVIARLSALLEKGASAGAWELHNARLTAVMLFDAQHGAVDDCLVGGETVKRPELIALVTRFYCNVLGLNCNFLHPR
jgi:AcrR family transcriptional regulator